MLRGKTEAETLKLNGWCVGDLLEGNEYGIPERILITAIGEEKFLCRWDYSCKGKYEEKESSNTTLSLREWKKVKPQMKVDKNKYLECVAYLKEINKTDINDLDLSEFIEKDSDKEILNDVISWWKFTGLDNRFLIKDFLSALTKED